MLMGIFKCGVVFVLVVLEVIGVSLDLASDFILENVLGRSEEHADYSEYDEYYLDEGLIKVYGNWDEASYQEKTRFLEVIKNMELNNLGVLYKVDLIYKELDELEGNYSHFEKTITIDKDLIEEHVLNVINTVAHECYHAYEHQCVDLYESLDENHKQLTLFENVEIYKNEFDNYISSKENYEKYYGQQVEIDSRCYASERVDYYFVLLSHLWKSYEQSQR